MNKTLILIFSFLLLITTSSTFAALKSINVGPEIGKISPEITVIDNKKQTKTIKQLSGKNGLIILFFRSADWCPYCKRHLIEFNDYAKNLTDLGYELAAISYDDTATLNLFSQQHKLSYPLLSDVNAKTMKTFNILNSQYKPGDENYGIPYPGVVVIDKDGKVSHKHFFEGYKKRVKFADLQTKLKMQF